MKSTAIPQQDALRITMLLAGLTRSITLYPPGNPALTRPLQDLRQLLADQLSRMGVLRIGLANDIIYVNEQVLVTPPAVVDELTNRLKDKKIGQIIVEEGLSEEDLYRFILLLSDHKLTAADINASLARGEVCHVRLTLPSEAIDDALRLEAGEAYQEALDAIRQAFADIEQQSIPDSSKIIAVTRHLTTVSLREPAVLVGLAMIKDYDNYTFSHSINVGVLAMALAANIGYDRQGIEETGIAGFLHDIGKTRIAKEIINKPGKLSAAEFAEMKKHPEKGVKIISEMIGISSKVAQAVLGHHIRHSRQGYPEWARQLPFNPISEIIAIADCYDASTTLRAYHQPLTPRKAVNELQKLAGDYLDSALVDQFVQMMGKYPIGTLVRLETNEIAVVIKPNPGNNDQPFIRIIIAADGTKLDQSVVTKLGETESGASMIVAEVDPLQKGIDVGGYFK
jgi:putative nucleotidyltransferase with HDIG domain